MDNKIYITNAEGKEVAMNILFTFEAEGKKYVIVYEDVHEDELYALSYDEQGNLFTVEDEEELAMIEEVIAAFDGTDDEETD